MNILQDDMKKIEDFLTGYKFLFVVIVVFSVLLFLLGLDIEINLGLMLVISILPIGIWLFLYLSYKAIYDHLIKIRRAINEDRKL